MKKIFLIGSICFSLASVSSTAFADTIAPNEITADTTWTKADSPYIIDSNGLLVDGGVTLTLEAGTVVKFDPNGFAGIYITGGTLNAEGTSADPVTFTASDPSAYSNNWIINAARGTFDAQYANFSYTSSPVYFTQSNGNFSHVTFNNVQNGLNLSNSSSVTISDSDLTSTSLNNTIGLSVLGSVLSAKSVTVSGFGEGVLLDGASFTATSSVFENNITGIQSGVPHYNYFLSSAKNILDFFFQKVFADAPNAVSISGSSFLDNTSLSILNIDSSLTVDARNNWWGSADGPGTQVSGSVSVDPWLVADPFVSPAQVCCSSVAFIPGIEGSRLAKTGLLTDHIPLWEPSGNDDVRKLFLDANGVSLDPSIYAEGIIDEGGVKFFGPNIYKSFENDMQALVDAGTIAGWKPLAYDWRYGVDDVVLGGTKQRDGTFENMITEIERLAANSKTGKVTIITHSTGGLTAKYIIKVLTEKGEANLIDKLITVALPEYGTPEAVGAILHGYKQGLGISIFGDVLLHEDVAREFSANLPGAYQLLPSKKYFDLVSTPVVTFDPSIDPLSNLHASYGNSISTFADLNDFLLATKDGRHTTPEDDILQPIVANSFILNKANALHDELDNIVIPPNIAVTQIAGWGLTTVSGMTYVATTTEECTFFLSCKTKQILDETANLVSDGDGTVVAPSATALGTSTKYYVNLHDFNDQLHANNSHSDILEVQPVRNLIQNFITGSTSTPPFVTLEKPIPQEENKRLRISVHSPVSIDIYDEAGNHTGLISNSNPASDLQLFEEQIPNSYYLPFGEGKYVGVGGDASTTIKLHGTGVGTFTLIIEEVAGDTVTGTNVYSGIPVSLTTQASLVVSYGTSTPLAVDQDGDGVVDYYLYPGQAAPTPTPSQSPATFAGGSSMLAVASIPAATVSSTPAPSPTLALLPVIQKQNPFPTIVLTSLSNTVLSVLQVKHPSKKTTSSENSSTTQNQAASIENASPAKNNLKILSILAGISVIVLGFYFGRSLIKR